MQGYKLVQLFWVTIWRYLLTLLKNSCCLTTNFSVWKLILKLGELHVGATYEKKLSQYHLKERKIICNLNVHFRG